MKRLCILLGLLVLGVPAFCEEVQPAQNIDVTNSYLTRVKIQRDDAVEQQNIKIDKCFLLWVTVQKQIKSEQTEEIIPNN